MKKTVLLLILAAMISLPLGSTTTQMKTAPVSPEFATGEQFNLDCIELGVGCPGGGR